MYNLAEKICIAVANVGISTPTKQNALLNLFHEPEKLLTEFESKKREIISLLGEANYLKLKYTINEKYADMVVNQLNQHNVKAVTLLSEQYPQKLLELDDKPLCLFCMGNTELLNSKCFSVVGARKISAYGKKVTEWFTRELSAYYTIVSGLAYGVDTVAHTTALQANGATIGVLGSGILNIYPQSNTQLVKKMISEGSLVFSEYPIYAKPESFHFPMRNRIVSALSECILVTEASIKSGTFSTVEHALQQGRDIFVVPGDIYSISSEGANDLIKNLQGAMVTKPRDILEKYKFSNNSPKKVQNQLDFNEQIVLNLLSIDKLHFDDIVLKSGLPASDVNFALSMLELKDLILKLPNNYYQAISED